MTVNQNALLCPLYQFWDYLSERVGTEELEYVGEAIPVETQGEN